MRERFDHIIQSNKPVLVDFYADWCLPCKQVPPILKQLKEQFGDSIRILKVNVDNNPVIASKYKIQSIPALFLFREGKLCWKTAGVYPAQVLRGKIQPFVNENSK